MPVVLEVCADANPSIGKRTAAAVQFYRGSAVLLDATQVQDWSVDPVKLHLPSRG